MISLSDIYLGEWLQFCDEVKALDVELKDLQELEDSPKKNRLLLRNMVKRSAVWANWFQIIADGVDEQLDKYNEFINQFGKVAAWEGSEIKDITFSQFIDAKMVASKIENRFNLCQYIAAIFYFGDYVQEYINETSAAFTLTYELALSDACGILIWYDSLNTEISKTYTLFQDSGEDEGRNMKQHMERWGWINFLKSVAKTKVFDIAGSGKDSIENARAAKLDDVLTWASEEKDYNIACMRDLKGN